ncbi:MAG: CBS domain-containing protein [Gammaproteobacteria bacterium]|nr:CBS domain-containing protein [Gammaproteobacteria bacterium]
MTLAASLQEAYLSRHPADAARTFETMKDPTLAPSLEVVSRRDPMVLVPILERLSPLRARALFEHMPREARARVLRAANPRLAVLLVGHLQPAELAERLADLPESVRAELERLLAFPEDSAGHLMDRVFDPVRPEMRVAEVLERLRAASIRRVRSLFVVDDDGRLIGRVDMQDLALADLEVEIASLMQRAEGAVAITSPREYIVEQLEETRLDALPVVDLDQRLLGVVRYASLFHAVEAEASADLLTMVGASADERALSTFGFAVRRRLPWLHINLLTAFLAASVVGIFESLIAQFTALAVLLPVVAGQSGNAGAQALAVTMRGLALREIGLRDWRAVLDKEAPDRSGQRRGARHRMRPRGLVVERHHRPRPGDRHRHGAVGRRRRDRRRPGAHRAHPGRPGSGHRLVDHPDHGHRRRRVLLVPGNGDGAQLPALTTVRASTGSITTIGRIEWNAIGKRMNL